MPRRLACLIPLAFAACDGGASGTADGGAPAGDGSGGDALAADGGSHDAPGGRELRVLYQCTPFGGGLCEMAADGSSPVTLHATGFAPRGLADGAILFHTAAYRVARRAPGGAITELGDGAFPRPAPNNRIVFQCTGLGGGICSMAPDGSDRTTLRATGRVPDIDSTGVLVFHSDGYRVLRRAPGGQELDLGAGAFARWAPGGGLVFQCTGLDGGLCRMAGDGSARTTLAATGRVPDGDPDGDLLFHDDAYAVSLRDASGVTVLRPGANAVWW